MRIIDCLCSLFRPGSGRRRVHASHTAAVARLAEVEPIVAEHTGCAAVLVCASKEYATLLSQHQAEQKRATGFEQQLTGLRIELEQAEQRHRREIDRALNHRRPIRSEAKTGAIDVRVLRASAAAERAILAVPAVERTLTMPPLRHEVLQHGRVRSLSVSPLAATIAEVSPTASKRAMDSVLAALGGRT
jgi:hypothetical protein